MARASSLLCVAPQDPAALRGLLQQRADVQVLGGVRSRRVRHDLQRPADRRGQVRGDGGGLQPVLTVPLRCVTGALMTALIRPLFLGYC